MPLHHVDYPHEPGRLYDCPACEAQCHCTPGTAQCVYDGEHKTHDPHGNCLDPQNGVHAIDCASHPRYRP